MSMKMEKNEMNMTQKPLPINTPATTSSYYIVNKKK